MKKILPILMVLFFVLPLKNGFAYDGGLLNSQPLKMGTSINGSFVTVTNLTDSNISTYTNLITTTNSATSHLIWYKFEEPVTIDSYRINADANTTLILYDNSLKVLSSNNIYIDGSRRYISPVEDVSYIAFKGTGSKTFAIKEVDVFLSEIRESISSLSETHDYKSVKLSWKNPKEEISGLVIKKDGSEIGDLSSSETSFDISGLIPKSTYKFDVIAKYLGGGFSEPVSISVTMDEAPKVNNLTAIPGHNSANLSWVNPSVSDFIGVRITKDGSKVVDLTKADNSYTITKLAVEEKYIYGVSALYDGGFQSDSVSVSFETSTLPPNAGDVFSLTADSKHNRVDLSWILPESENFKHVNIYRETLKKSFFDKMLGINTVMAATPIFETNGTYFNDLTVQSETKYEYTLTTTSTEKIESDGVSITVTTLKDPTPEIGGGGHEKDPETGDYTYYWVEPKTGKVKVMVAGKLYATVPASDGKIVIPADKMKYTLFGSPDVQLIPVDEEGNEGKPVKPPSGGGGGSSGGGDVTLPFEVSDVMKITFSLIALLSGLILLVLALDLTPRLLKLIKNSLAKKGAVK